MGVLTLTTLLLTVWVAHSLSVQYRNPQPLASGAISGWVISWWIWAGLSVLWSVTPAISQQFFWWIAGLPLAYLATYLNPISDGGWHRLLWWLRLLGVLLVGYGFALWMLNGDSNFRATFINHNNLAALLNLLLFPLAAEMLMPSKAENIAWKQGVVFLVLALGVALTLGRGAGLAMVGGLLLLSLLFVRMVSKRKIIQLLGLVMLAYLISFWVHQGGWQRIESLALSSLGMSAQPRWIIWEATWQMGWENPWFGSGLGTFAQQFSQFQHPLDGRRYFVHNDYLQAWQEQGVPGLLLLLGITGWIVLRWWDRFIDHSYSIEERLQVSGLAMGLGAVLLHTTLTFNLYIPAILILMGLYLAKLQQDTMTRPLPLFTFNQQLRPLIFNLMLVVGVGVPILFLGRITLSDWKAQQALEAVEERDWLEADRLYLASTNYWSGYPARWVDRAKIRRIMLQKMRRQVAAERRWVQWQGKHHQSELNIFQRVKQGASGEVQFSPVEVHSTHPALQKKLFTEGVGLLDQAKRGREGLAEQWLERARFFRQFSDLTEQPAEAVTRMSYQQLIRLSPNYTPYRKEYIEYLQRLGDPVQAWAVLLDGLNNPRYPGIYAPRSLKIFSPMAQRLQDYFGEGAGNAIEQQVMAILHRFYG